MNTSAHIKIVGSLNFLVLDHGECLVRTIWWDNGDTVPCYACRGTGGRMGKLVLMDDYFRCLCPFTHDGEKRAEKAELESRMRQRMARNGLSEDGESDACDHRIARAHDTLQHGDLKAREEEIRSLLKWPSLEVTNAFHEHLAWLKRDKRRQFLDTLGRFVAEAKAHDDAITTT